MSRYISKTGWERIDQGVWYSTFADQKYELSLLCNTGVGSVAVIGHLRKLELHAAINGLDSSPFSKYSEPFGYLPKEVTYATIVRRYVRHVHDWANSVLRSPMTLLGELLPPPDKIRSSE